MQCHQLVRVGSIAALLALAACSSPGTTTPPGIDSGPGQDSGEARDSGALDSGGADSGIDSGSASCPDLDSDGQGDVTCGGIDCDDSDPRVYGGATEVCDAANLDEDCNPETFGERDSDGDSYFDVQCCNPQPGGGAPRCGNDCDDSRETVHPTEAESCDGLDNDCNRVADDGLPLMDYFPDCDGDLFGDRAAASVRGCAPPAAAPACPDGHWVTNGTDCDDDDRTRSPSAAEVCGDGIDSNCDGDDNGSVPNIWYPDTDGDGYGVMAGMVSQCSRPGTGYVLRSEVPDCDDRDPTVSPGTVERCNGRDDDCDPVRQADNGMGPMSDCAARPEVLGGVCMGGRCMATSCLAGYGDCVVDDPGVASTLGCETRTAESVTHCGACGTMCRFGPRSAPSCNGSMCGLVCETGAADCDGMATTGCEAVLATDASHCGRCGNACPGAANARATCAGSTCGFACLSTHGDCDGMASNGCEVALEADPRNCGACGNDCTALPNVASATCSPAGCVLGPASCDPGYGNCDGSAANGCERATRDDPANCGACGMMCPGTANGAAICTGTTCATRCNPGYALAGNTCSPIPAPRPVAPLSGHTATSRRPTFRWELGAVADGARLEICASRACTTILQSLEVTGTSAAPTTDLPTGTVYWRLYGRAGASIGLATSPVWQLAIGARSATASTSWGTVPDFNGDGRADLVTGAPGAVGSAGRAHVCFGADPLPTACPSVVLAPPPGGGGQFGARSGTGDFNGDGLVDLAVSAVGAGPTNRGRTYIFNGRSSGFGLAPPDVTIAAPASVGPGSTIGYDTLGAGDVNGDGYADLFLGARVQAFVYHGGPSGLGTTPVTTIPASSGTLFGFFATAGDFNADGYGDVAFTNYTEGNGRVFVHLGSTMGIGATATRILESPGFALFANGGVAAADANGDGYTDLFVGYFGGAGTLYVFPGSPVGVAATAARTVPGPAGVGFAGALASCGDVNRDGFEDLFVGQWLYPAAGDDRRGRAYVFLGDAAGVGTAPSATYENPDGYAAYFGLAGAGGDMDGDGYSDLAVGSYASDSIGRARVYRGSASGTSPAASLTFVGPEAPMSYFGSPVDL